MITLNDGDELLLRDVAVRVLVQLQEQLLCLGHVRGAVNHLVHGKYGSEKKKRYDI